MNKDLDRDYVWECDYGVRKPLVTPLRRLLREQNASSLQMVSIFANNNPYHLEMYVVFSYDKPLENHISTMINEMEGLGVRYRPDITLKELILEYKNKRFNSRTFYNEQDIDEEFNTGSVRAHQRDNPSASKLFAFVEKEVLESKGYITKPLGNKFPVFLSHSSIDKLKIKEFIPYLNGAGVAIWYDEVNIDYGDSIEVKVKQGIKNSGAVIFWITQDFLKSDWCNKEMEAFLRRVTSKEDVFILSIISKSTLKDDIPPFILDRKNLVINDEDSLGKIAKQVTEILKVNLIDKKKLDLFIKA